ncbi:DUF2306 domain-containing protein [Spongiimicrobium salis]|uniref:DUF2306 domain-containing protein n=1 Tax=Spongiimicrobium salis TaxID=1667022 RepID=UPI00374C8CE5
MFSNTTGIVHLIASIIALLTGTLVLVMTKGSPIHRKVGYLYVFSMSILLGSSFMIYRLHGTFGILHLFSVISSLTLLAGMIPMVLRKPKNYFSYHVSFMYWSVIGLYCAFCAEVFTRIPFLIEVEEHFFSIFYALVGISIAIVSGIGSRYFRKYKKGWEQLRSA